MAGRITDEQRMEVLHKLLDGGSYSGVAQAMGLTVAEVARVWQDYSEGALAPAAARPAHLAEAGASLRRLEDLASETQRLEERRTALRAEMQELERQASSGRKAAEQLTAMGLPPWELHSFVQRLTEIAERKRVPAARLREELLETLERVDAIAAVEGTLRERKSELARAEAGIEGQRAANARLSGTLAGLRREQEHLEELMPAMRAQTTTDIKRIGDEAALAIREQAATLRRELDSLLQQSLDVAKTAAAVDAEVRAKEWLRRLLDLVEGGDDLRPQDVRPLAHTLFTAFARWMERHPSTLPAQMQGDLEKLISKIREWRG